MPHTFRKTQFRRGEMDESSIEASVSRPAKPMLIVDAAQLAAITNSIEQMIWSTRPDGFHDFYNQRWYEYTGVPSDSTDGEAWNAISIPTIRSAPGRCGATLWRPASPTTSSIGCVIAPVSIDGCSAARMPRRTTPAESSAGTTPVPTSRTSSKPAKSSAVRAMNSNTWSSGARSNATAREISRATCRSSSGSTASSARPIGRGLRSSDGNPQRS